MKFFLKILKPLNKALSVLFLTTVFAGVASASTQVIVGGINAAPSTSAVRYNLVMGGESWKTTEVDAVQVVSTVGTFNTLNISIATAPGASKSWTFVVRKNEINTTLTCAISGTATSCSDLVNSFSVVAGDRITIKVTPSGTPTSSNNIRWSVNFVSSTARESLGLKTIDVQAIDGTYYLPIFGEDTGETVEANAAQVMPMAGTIKNLHVYFTDPSTNTFTFVKNGVEQSVTCTLSSNTCSDTTQSFTFNAGDKISIKTVVTDPFWGGLGFTIVANNDGEFVIGNVESNFSNSVTNYNYLVFGATPNSIETNRSQIVNACTIKKIYINSSAAPGSGKSYTATLRKMGNTDTALTVTLSDSETADNFATDITLAGTDLLNTKIEPSGLPAAATLSIGYLGYVAPEAGGTERRIYFID